MDFVYKNYFENNLYPSLVLEPEDGKYTVRDANEAFLNLMQVEKGSIKDKDFLGMFLSYNENIVSMTTCIIRTSLAYVQAFRVSKKIDKIGVIHSFGRKRKKIRYWEIYIYPMVSELGVLDSLIYVSKEIGDEDNTDEESK